MPAGRAGRRALFGVLFLLSGAAGLVYEQLWIRELQHVFGSTIHSITTVVAAYMGGLGLGAWVMGRRADAHRNPARLYGVLELAIGLFGLASPWIFRAIGSGYLAFARAAEPGLWAATAVKALAAFLVMLVPTFLMGATLPVLTRAFAGPNARGLRRELALFYGLNTVGGVAGCALAGYVLVERVGMRPALLATGVLNLLLGAVALALVRGRPALTTAPIEADAEAPSADASAATRRTAVWLIGITAFASLLFEIAWTRVLILVVGSSTYAFTTMLACFLLGIGIGSLVAVGRGLPAEVLLERAALVLGSVAALASLLFPFFRMLPTYIVFTLRLEDVGPSFLLALQAIPIAVVVIPPAIGFGMAFPLLTELASRRDGGPGQETGRAYLANTAGSITGSVVTGFVLIHLVGAERTLVLGVAITVAATVLLMRQLGRERGTGWRRASGERGPLLLGVLALVVAVFTPAWSRRLLDRGPAIYGHDIRTASQLDAFLRGLGAEQLRFDEGWNATISVWRNGTNAWLKTNGKADASSVADMNAQVLVGLLPALAHPRPARALIIGFGSGTTARTVADARGVTHLDVVEIERAVLRAAPLFADVNRGVLADPRLRLIEDDARSALQLGGPDYDIVVSEPSNPWVAGVAGLFTPEFFGIVRSRLADDGVFAQWVQTYRVPAGVVAVVVANLRRVFPHVEMWYANSADLILLASNRPVRWDRARIAQHLAPGTPSAAAMHDWLLLTDPDDLLGRFVMGDRGTAALAATATFTHDDDRPALEFVAARGLLAASAMGGVFDSVLSVRAAVGDTVPQLDDWPLAPGAWQASYARALPTGSALARPMAERAVALAPRNAAWRGELGRLLYDARNLQAALPILRKATQALPTDARFHFLAGAAALATGDTVAGTAYLERARTLGGDSVWATSLLAESAVLRKDYARAAVEATRALNGLRPTLATLFPAALQGAVQRLALEGPPELAAPVLDLAGRTRPGWDLAWWGGAIVYARWGGAHCRRAAELASALDRFGWTDKEMAELLTRCGPR